MQICIIVRICIPGNYIIKLDHAYLILNILLHYRGGNYWQINSFFNLRRIIDLFIYLFISFSVYILLGAECSNLRKTTLVLQICVIFNLKATKDILFNNQVIS